MEKGPITITNEIFKAHYGRDMTDKEAWEVFDFMKDLLYGKPSWEENEKEKA